MAAQRFILPKSAADYAAIAVAPLLVFLMISSLANFLMLILYHGGFPQRLAWTLLMFTLGAVGIARVAIERDRSYALGYGGILGMLTYVAMLRFVDSPVFSFFILIVIAYLADVIVRDCTLIDDSVDASGQGLIDSGRLFVKQRIEQGQFAADENDPESEQPKKKSSRKTHQPGRTVMYLALGALPLFGLGQFFLRNDPNIWSRAQLLLAVYLFASLSLLVTTSFLGLRRYLRQRKVEMPSDVSIGWLAGGLAMIAAVLMIAYVAPLPGRALASLEMPEFLDSPGGTEASRFGWGEEGADKSRPGTPKTSQDPNAEGKETQGQRAARNAPPGDVGQGNRKEGPPGKQQGGQQQTQGPSQPSQGQPGQKQPSQNQQGQSQQGQNQQSRGQQTQRQPNPDQPSQNQQSQSQQADNASKDGSQPSKSEQGQPRDGGRGEQKQSAGDSSAQPSESRSDDGQKAGEKKQDGSSRESSSDSETQSRNDTPPGDESSSREQTSEPSAKRDPSREDASAEESDATAESQDSAQSDQSSGGLPPEGSASQESSSSPGALEQVANSLPMLVSVIKGLIFMVLAGIVIAFLWLHRDLIAQWWRSLFAGRSPAKQIQPEELPPIEELPARPFSSFRNPIGKESDLRRIVVVTFQAFEAWTREQGTPRHKDETPAEFIRRVAQSVPQMSKPASQVVDAYNRIVYGRGRATKKDVNAAEKVWQFMTSAQM